MTVHQGITENLGAAHARPGRLRALRAAALGPTAADGLPALRDWATAEDLLQTALAKAWLAWRRVGENPDPYVYRILANTHASWWRRRWRGERPTDVLPAWPPW